MVGGYQVDPKMGVAGTLGTRAAVGAEHRSLGSQGSPAECQDGPLVTSGHLPASFHLGKGRTAVQPSQATSPGEFGCFTL